MLQVFKSCDCLDKKTQTPNTLLGFRATDLQKLGVYTSLFFFNLPCHLTHLLYLSPLLQVKSHYNKEMAKGLSSFFPFS